MNTPEHQTYSRLRKGARGKFEDIVRLYRVRTNDVDGQVAAAVRELDIVSTIAEQRGGTRVCGKRVLIVGAGQTPRETIGFGAANEVTAIDLDVIPQGWDPRQYVQLIRQNGATRATKTLGRKVLGVDYRFQRAMRRAVDETVSAVGTGTGAKSSGSIRHLQMDASRMTFAANTFDVVYSFSVFEHLPDPAAVLTEAVRVLKPGGLLYISTHIYSSEGGCHDLRIFAGDRDAIPYWAHLRPTVKSTVTESCYMNMLSLDAWRPIFTAVCPEIEFRLEGHHEPYATFLRAELARLRANGELTPYTDDDLLTVNLKSIWVKPTGPA